MPTVETIRPIAQIRACSARGEIANQKHDWHVFCSDLATGDSARLVRTAVVAISCQRRIEWVTG